MQQIRILLADDHTIIRSGLRLLLDQQPDFKVVAEASDGREAVERRHLDAAQLREQIRAGAPRRNHAWI